MVRNAKLLLICLTAASAGCAVARETLYGMMATQYTGGGVTSYDKERDIRQRVDAWSDAPAP